MAVFWGVAFEVGTQSFLVRRETGIGRLLALLGPKTHSGSVKNTPEVDTTNSIRCMFCPPTPEFVLISSMIQINYVCVLASMSVCLII